MDSGINRRGVGPEIGERPQQDVPVLGAGVGRVLADPRRLAVGLDELDPVLHRVVGEQVPPGDHAGEAGADRQAGLGLEAVHHELERGERPLPVVGAAQAQGAPVHAVEREPARVAVLEAHGPPPALGEIPHDLGHRIALAQRVEDVDQLVLEGLGGEPVAHEIGVARGASAPSSAGTTRTSSCATWRLRVPSTAR